MYAGSTVLDRQVDTSRLSCHRQTDGRRGRVACDVVESERRDAEGGRLHLSRWRACGAGRVVDHVDRHADVGALLRPLSERLERRYEPADVEADRVARSHHRLDLLERITQRASEPIDGPGALRLVERPSEVRHDDSVKIAREPRTLSIRGPPCLFLAGRQLLDECREPGGGVADGPVGVPPARAGDRQSPRRALGCWSKLTESREQGQRDRRRSGTRA